MHPDQPAPARLPGGASSSSFVGNLRAIPPQDRVAALIVCLFAGAAGVWPHLRWSFELGQAGWFFSSYDEGFYGWSALTGILPVRFFSTGAMRLLHIVSGQNPQMMMVLADLVLPAASALAAYYLVRPLCRTSVGSSTATLFVLMAAECLALRSHLIPHAGIHAYLREVVVPFLGGPSGILQIENQTGTFWLFRTPEPQFSWIWMFLLLGWITRLTQRLDAGEVGTRWSVFFAGCVALGFGYLFCALSTGSVLLLLALLVARNHPGTARWIALGAGLMILVSLGLSFLTATYLGGESYDFPSRQPVLLLSTLIGSVAAVIMLARGRFAGRLPATGALALALALTALILPNQHLFTGRMIYLMNFENFALGPMTALALLLACVRPAPPGNPPRSGSMPRVGRAMAWAAALALGGILVRSQARSYDQNLPQNLSAESYRLALRTLQPDPRIPVICDDFLATDILAVKLGHRPNYLLARDEVFTRPLHRLVRSGELPGNGAPRRRALYRYLAATGVTPAEFHRRLQVLIDPSFGIWQDRTFLGSALYNPIDYSFWFTHGRANKTDWVAAQLPMIEREYAAFLRERFTEQILFLAGPDHPGFPADTMPAPVKIGANLGTATYPLQAYRIGVAP